MQQRKLGYWESVLCLLHDRLLSTGTIMTMSQIDGRLDVDIIRQVVDLLMQRHPLLCAALSEKEDGYHFELTATPSSVPITVYSRIDDTHWQLLVEQQLLEPIDTNQAMWRVVLLQSDNQEEQQNELIFLIHHAIADGLSCVHLNAQCLDYYQRLSVGEQVTVDSLPFYDAVERLLDCAQLPDHQHAGQEAVTPTPFYYQQVVPLAERRTKNIYRTIEDEELATFVSACKQKSYSINAVLNAIMLIVVSEMKRDTIDLTLLTPVNLRSYCEPKITLDDFGCYISCVTTQHPDVDFDDDVWQLAADYSEQLQEQIANLDQLPTDLPKERLEQQSQLLRCHDAQTRTEFPAGFVVTNKGRIDVPVEYGELTWRQYFTTSSRRAGDIVVNLSVTTIHKKMFLCFSYTKPLLTDEWVERLVDRFVTRCASLS